MKRGSIVWLGLLFTGLLSAIGVWSAPGRNNPRPNVVLIITDDQGYGDLHCHGNSMIRTPNLDRLYEQSVRLTNFHVDPTCSPTRSALMTGRYSTRTGVWHTIAGRSLLAHDEVTLGDLFKGAGYRTAMIGKWHLGDNCPMRPEDHGFEEVLRIGGGGIGQTPDYWGNDYFDDTYLHNGRYERFTGYCTDVFFDHAIKFIREHKTEPFFIYLAPNAAHWPYRVAEPYRQYYMQRGVPEPMASFYGMIENIDENIGRLMQVLDEEGLSKNTILIFMTDNGTAAGYRPNARSGWRGFNAGMRGTKGSQYEGGHRVPCFVRWPAGGIGGGKDVSRLTAHFDILPTLVELCNLQLPDRLLDGRSLVPLLKNPQAPWPERTLFVHVQRQEIPPKWIRSAVLTERWRLVDGKELYNIQNDPGQQHDIAADHPDVVAALRQRYEQWWQSLEPVFQRVVPIRIGSSCENPVRLTCHDWHSNRVPWDQSSVRRDPWANGWWAVQVASAGRYRITLRQRPRQVVYPLQGTRARIQIGELVKERPIPQGATEVDFTVELQPGQTRFQSWIIDEQSGRSRGAFFVYIHYLGPDAGPNNSTDQ